MNLSPVVRAVIVVLLILLLFPWAIKLSLLWFDYANWVVDWGTVGMLTVFDDAAAVKGCKHA